MHIAGDFGHRPQLIITLSPPKKKTQQQSWTGWNPNTHAHQRTTPPPTEPDRLVASCQSLAYVTNHWSRAEANLLQAISELHLLQGSTFPRLKSVKET